MEASTLRALLRARGLSQSELARRIGVSRQAISQWLRKDGPVNLQGRHLVQVSRALDLPISELIRPLPCCEPQVQAVLSASLLWDHLYLDLVDFAIALNQGHPRALARLVEVYGLYASEKMLGTHVWTEFPRYKRYLHPARRRQLEALHAWHSNQIAA